MDQDMSIAALLGRQIMAVDLEAARGLLAQRVPRAVALGAVFAADAGDLRIEAGERFGIYRGVAVMPVRGILTPASAELERYLGWATYQGIVESCAALAASPDVAAVILEFDSPGGMTRAMASAVEAIAALAKVKPVYALVNPLAASAAYGLAAQAADITLIAGAEVGSIGVMLEGADPVAPDMMGDQWRTLTSSHARAKRPSFLSEAGVALWQVQLDRLEGEFHASVAAGRKMALADLLARVSLTDNPADGGGMFGGADAVARGLADRVATRAGFYEAVFAKHGVRAKAAQDGARAIKSEQARALAAAALAVAQG